MEFLTQLKADYTAYLLSQGQRPPSVQAFMEQSDKSEADFYEVMGSFEGLEQSIFLDYFQRALDTLKQSSEYQGYDSGQRFAALYFTWLEVLGDNRSIVNIIQKHDNGWLWPEYLEAVKTPFNNFIKELLQDGVDEDEIADRWFFNNTYPTILWEQAKNTINYWLNDNSQGFERTDAMVEKQVRFVFDLISPNLIDSGWDLIRYVVQGK
ncbi:MAG: TetR family transcriptional regulator C-terminal domain-containing protein [Bacteroidota bacterium]